MKEKIFFVFVLIILCVTSQKWGGFQNANQGARLAHLYAGQVTLTGGDNITGIFDLTQKYTTTIAEGIFQASQQIYIGTGILDIEIDDTTGDYKYLEVTSAGLSADRTKIQIELNDNDADENVFTTTYYTKLRLSVIAIGSNFPGYSDTVESSYIYAKNSQMQTIAPTDDSHQFDFSTSSISDSPFAYLPDTNLGAGCGIIRKDGNLILQTSNCQFRRFYTYITGFSYNSHNGLDVNVGAVLNFQVGDKSPYSYYFQDTSVSSDNKDDLFKQNPNDTQIGLPLRVTDFNQPPSDTSILKKVQASFVFVGIRDWEPDNYPAQSPVFQDDFIHFGTVSSISDYTTSLTIVSSVAGNINFKELENTYQNIDQKIGHAFCGFSAFSFESGSDQLSITSQYTFQALDIKVQTSTDRTFTEQIIMSSCVLITSRDVCESQLKMVPLLTSDAETIKINPNNFGIGNLEPVTVLPIGQSSALDGQQLLYQPTLKFKFNPLADNDNEALIIIKYNRPASSVYRGIISFDDHPLEENDSLKVSVFGKTIIDQSITASVAANSDYKKQFAIYNTDQTQNTIQIMYKGSRTGVVEAGSLEIGLISYPKVIDGKCSDQCSQKSDFQTGFTGNIDDIPICTYCDSTQNSIFKPIEGKCGCQINFYLDGTRCSRCTDQLCAQCDNDVCTTCVSNAQNPNSCTCSTGFYKSTQQLGKCLQCNTACVSCSSSTICTACKYNNDTRESASLGCVCKAGYYDNGNLICQKCNLQCAKCEGSADRCTQCDTANNFMMNQGSCICRAGYYLLRTDTTATCQQCDSQCKQCIDSPIKCTQCDQENDFRISGPDNTCKCKDGFIELAGECIDSSCSSEIPFCQSCAYDPLNNQFVCLKCTDNRVVSNSDGTCQCKVGYYESSGSCVKCGQGCALCGIAGGELRCFDCAAGFEKQNSDGTCTCPIDTVLVEAAGTLYCKPCSSKCATCVGDYDKCASCNDPAVLDISTKTCICPLRYYLAANGQCLSCISDCEICSDGNTCDLCDPIFALDPVTKKCILNCPSGTYRDGSSCAQCAQGCADCVNGYTCITCENDYLLHFQTCVLECPSGTYQDTEARLCYSCNSPCRTCSGPAINQCDSCIDGYAFFNNQCLEDCVQGTFYADGSCLLCNLRCKACVGSSSYCTECYQGQYLYQNTCLTQCPVAIVDGKCTDKCPDGKYLSGNTCISCSSNCQTCSGSATNCLRCSSGLKSYQGECFVNCPDNSLDEGSYCTPCDPKCDGCTGNSLNCSNCPAGLVKSGTTCIQACLQGQYFDSLNQQCQQCGVGCKFCFDSTRCSECFDQGQSPINGVCAKTCPTGAKLVNDECVCTIGFQYADACVSKCPEGYYSLNNVCEPCQYPCKNCVTLATNCLSCKQGFQLDQLTRQCRRYTVCPYGQYDSNGNCKHICNNGLLFYKTSCVFVCPLGYNQNSYGACVQGVSTICNSYQYMQGTECVSTCSIGFFGNQQTRMCESCKSNCQVCISAEGCVSCKQGYIFVDGNCIESLGCQIQYNGQCVNNCPVGTYRSGNTCMRACPQNSYYYGFYCYQTCPTGQNTSEACI